MKKLILFLIIPFICFSQSVYFDGDDRTEEVVANWRSSDNTGTFLVWAKFDNFNASQWLFTSCDEGANAQKFALGVDVNGYIRLVVLLKLFPDGTF